MLIRFFIFFFRLYEEDQFEELPDNTPPEMVRSDLAYAIISLMALGIGRDFFPIK